MNKVLRASVVLLAAITASAFFAQGAWAHPDYPQQCTSCHGGANVGVTANLASVTTTSATYNVSAPTATAIAVFNGTTKVTYKVGTSAQLKLAFGSTYKIISVKGPGTGSGLGQMNVTPVADAIAPVSTSHAASTYSGTAAFNITATDAGGAGVAHTYYILDGGATVAGTAVSNSVVGAHTLEFWSVDAVGNAELHKFAAFTVTPPAPTTSSNAVSDYVGTASITLSATQTAGPGVAHTYYKLDSGVATEGVLVVTKVLGSHRLEYWSDDTSGNVEAPHKVATFAVRLGVKIARTPSFATVTVVRKAGIGRYTLGARFTKPNGAVWTGLRVIVQTRTSSTKPWATSAVLVSNSAGKVSKAFSRKTKATIYYRWYVPTTARNLSAAAGSQKVVVK